MQRIDEKTDKSDKSDKTDKRGKVRGHSGSSHVAQDKFGPSRSLLVVSTACLFAPRIALLSSPVQHVQWDGSGRNVGCNDSRSWQGCRNGIHGLMNQTTSAFGTVHSVVSLRSTLCRAAVAAPHHGVLRQLLVQLSPLLLLLVRHTPRMAPGADQFFVVLFSHCTQAAWSLLKPGVGWHSFGSFSQLYSAGVCSLVEGHLARRRAHHRLSFRC